MKNRADNLKVGRSLVRLPKWFSLEKYARAVGLDAHGWYSQVGVRRLCFDVVVDMKRAEQLRPEWHEVCRTALTSLQDEPICQMGSSPFDHEAFSFCRKSRLSESAPVVRSMTLRDLYVIDRRTRRCLTPSDIDYAQRMVSDHGDTDTVFLIDRPKWMDATVDNLCWGGVMPVMIDLAYPNTLLKALFEIHLRELRRHPGGRPDDAGKHSPDLREWAEMGVLPCMDLLLWAKGENHSIPNSVIANALGPQGDEVAVRKTIRPLAMGLLTGELGSTMERVRAMAHADFVQRQQVRDSRYKRKAS
jgi:hypothetical protein